jgi:hypothetical protein
MPRQLRVALLGAGGTMGRPPARNFGTSAPGAVR